MEEATIFRLLALFLGISFVLLVILFVLLTVRNNRRFRHTLRKEVLHDERKLEQRKEVLEEFLMTVLVLKRCGILFVIMK